LPRSVTLARKWIDWRGLIFQNASRADTTTPKKARLRKRIRLSRRLRASVATHLGDRRATAEKARGQDCQPIAPHRHRRRPHSTRQSFGRSRSPKNAAFSTSPFTASVLLGVVIGARVRAVAARAAGTATVTPVIVVGAPLIRVMAGIGEASCQRTRQRKDTERCSQEPHAVLLLGDMQ
jgi:hypothetical protein